MSEISDTGRPPPFDEREAQALLGRHLLVGITRLTASGTVEETLEYYGRVVRATPEEGIVLVLQGSREERALPPDLSAIKVAPPGQYRLKSTGEVVQNPDRLATWTVSTAAQDNPPAGGPADPASECRTSRPRTLGIKKASRADSL